MSVFSRLSDIINSNIVHMLDRAEDPEKMVRLMIQEMEDTLVEVKASAARVIADRKGLERRLEQTQEELKLWSDRAVLAVENGRDDLARAALEEKKRRQDDSALLEQQIADITNRISDFRDDITKLESKLDETKKKQKSIVTRKQAAESRLSIRDRLANANSNSTFTKFEKMERNLERLESEVDLFRQPRTSPLDDAFKQLETRSEIDEELARLKQSMRSSANSVREAEKINPVEPIPQPPATETSSKRKG